MAALESYKAGMNTELRATGLPFEAGQLWKLDEGYLQVTDLGKKLIYYKILRQPTQKAALTRLIRIEALANFLKQNEAQLVTQLAA
jgi:hypothetical protein